MRLLVIACVLLAATGCGVFGSDSPTAGAKASGSSPSPSARPTTPAALPEDICTLLTADDVSAIWERPVPAAQGDNLEDVVPGGRACTYTMSPGRLDVLIKPAEPDDTILVGPGDVTLPGLGESAVVFNDGHLAVLWGGYNYALTAERTDLDGETQLERLTATASKLHDKLG